MLLAFITKRRGLAVRTLVARWTGACKHHSEQNGRIWFLLKAAILVIVVLSLLIFARPVNGRTLHDLLAAQNRPAACQQSNLSQTNDINALTILITIENSRFVRGKLPLNKQLYFSPRTFTTLKGIITINYLVSGGVSCN